MATDFFFAFKFSFLSSDSGNTEHLLSNPLSKETKIWIVKQGEQRSLALDTLWCLFSSFQHLFFEATELHEAESIAETADFSGATCNMTHSGEQCDPGWFRQGQTQCVGEDTAQRVLSLGPWFPGSSLGATSLPERLSLFATSLENNSPPLVQQPSDNTAPCNIMKTRRKLHMAQTKWMGSLVFLIIFTATLWHRKLQKKEAEAHLNYEGNVILNQCAAREYVFNYNTNVVQTLFVTKCHTFLNLRTHPHATAQPEGA